MKWMYIAAALLICVGVLVLSTNNANARGCYNHHVCLPPRTPVVKPAKTPVKPATPTVQHAPAVPNTGA